MWDWIWNFRNTRPGQGHQEAEDDENIELHDARREFSPKCKARPTVQPTAKNALRVLALGETVAVQNIEDTLPGLVVLSLSELGEVWLEALLNLGNRLVH